jgi:hypothetical protein
MARLLESHAKALLQRREIAIPAGKLASSPAPQPGGEKYRHPYVVTRGGAEASHRGVQAACTWEPRGYEEACRG